MSRERINRYVDLFKTNYNGNPWYGESIDKKLTDITDTIAFRQPASGIHCIAELLHHMTYWRMPLISRLEGNRDFNASMESEENWNDLTKLKSIGWTSIKQEFDSSQEKLTRLLPAMEDSFLDEKFHKHYSYNDLIQGIIDHDIYHLGQIGLVKKMVAP